MALTIKHLNTDASFQVTFTPISPPAYLHPPPTPFHILLDPWITGSSKILHSKFSLTRQKHPACITSLTQLPTPDLVIISQSKSDHCNEATLCQLPRDGPTLILADPTAARIIRSWRHFDPRKVRALPRYGDDKDAVVRLPLRGGGERGGEIGVAWIPQRRDLTGLHAAVGITFRPPALTSVQQQQQQQQQQQRGGAPVDVAMAAAAATTATTPPATPISPVSTLRSARSLSTLTTLTPTLTNASTIADAVATPVAAAALHHPSSASASASAQRTLSLLFSPHGMPFVGPLSLYATTHLVHEAALPLTALLHCFDSVTNPWWLGGNVLLGAPAGREIALRLGARVWVSCHDGAKEVKGLATGWLRTRRWEREDVQKGVYEEDQEGRAAMRKRGEKNGLGRTATADPKMAPLTPRTLRSDFSAPEKDSTKGTQVLDLASGEEVVLTSEGVWDAAGEQVARKSWRGNADTSSFAVMGHNPNFHTLNEIMDFVPSASVGTRHG